MQPSVADLRRRSRGPWGRVLGRAIRAHERRSKNRRDYRQLLSLDDRMLKDIGITRDSVRHEMHRTHRWFV